MKTTEKTFDAVRFMRQQRDKLSEKLSTMTKEEILEYFNERKTQTTIKPGTQQQELLDNSSTVVWQNVGFADATAKND